MQRAFFLSCLLRTVEFLKLGNRSQTRQVTELLTGHCNLKDHLYRLRIIGSPICERRHIETETALHILCECVGLAELGIRRLGKLFTKPSDYV
jgi:hypothetical protein